MKRDDKIDYAIFIISHGRPNVQKTYDFLTSKQCTKNTFIVCDDLDPTLNEYLANFGDRVIVFDKKKYMATVDVFHNSPNPGHPVYVRNAVYDLAIERGFRFFVSLDDDMSAVRIRTAKAERGTEYVDEVFQSVFRFMRDAGLYVYGGAWNSCFYGGFADEIIFGGVNAYFCDTQRRVDFKCQYNEDTIVPLMYNKVGKMICTTCHLHFYFQTDGQNEGGIEYTGIAGERYKFSIGTFIGDPAQIKITYKSPVDIPISKSKYAHPMILSEKWRKPR